MNRKVLIVEDEKDLAVLMSYQLARADIDCFRAANGWQGLSVLDEVNPDLIITDIVMPEMDGYELCKKLEERGTMQKIPVIVLTAYANRIDEFKGLGVREFLIKPFESGKLIETIQRLFITMPQPQTRPMKKILVQGVLPPGVQMAVKQFQEMGYDAEVKSILEEPGPFFTEEVLRQKPDVLILDAMRKNPSTSQLIKALRAYVFLKKMAIVVYGEDKDEKKPWWMKKDSEKQAFEEIKKRCLQAGAVKQITSLDQGSFFSILSEFCRY